MTPLLKIRKRDRCNAWLTIDLRDDEDVGNVIVIPAFGRNHHCGLDCWCHPAESDGLFVHNAEH